MKRTWKRAIMTMGVLGAICGAFFAGRARANGIPTQTPNIMTYSGVLQNGDGTPYHPNIDTIVEVKLWPSQNPGANPLCTSHPQTVKPDVAGRFSVPVDECVAVVKTNADVSAEVLVGSTSLGKTKVSAVPYAVEAESAKSADPGNFSIPGDATVAGILSVGLGNAPCATAGGATTCTCAAGEYALSGGALPSSAQGVGFIVESRAISTNAWKFVCKDDAGAVTQCAATRVICARMK